MFTCKTIGKRGNKPMNEFILNAGLNDLVNTVRENWIGPIFLIIVAGVSITFLIQRQIRNLLIFVGIAAVVGALIFFGENLFGSNGSLTKTASDGASKINAILPTLSFLK